MYQTLNDLEKNILDYQTEENKPRKWVKWTFLVLWLVVLFLIVLIVYNLKIKDNPSLLWQSLGNKINLGEDSVYSRVFQLSTKESEDNEIQSKNAEILSQLKDEAFWEKKIEEIVKKKIERIHEFDSNNFEVVWYWLECNEEEKDLSKCKYDVWFIYKYEVSPQFNNWVWYDSFGDNGYCGWWYHRLTYSCIVKYLAMKDIWFDKVFYKAWNDYSYWEDKYDMLDKYMWSGFEYTWDIRDVHFVQYIVLENWVANYYKYIIDDDWQIMFKDVVKFITRDDAEKIIANNASISPSDIKYLRLNAEDEIYTCDFSYNWHTYKYTIDAKNWSIINGLDEIDIWDEKAMEIALKDSWIDAEDLREDVSHWHWEMKTLLMPEINKEWTGSNAIYNVEIETEDDRLYTYIVRATDGKILLKHLSEQFIIYDKEWTRKNMTYKIKSTHKKPKKLEIKPSELDMDDIYEYKDQIYLWITFDWDKIVDWSIIDRPYKHMWKMTKNDLDEYYNFESHYSTKTIDKIFSESTEIKLSEFDENVLYKIKIWQICRLNIINDTENDVIVYQGYYWEGEYETTPYLKEWYAWSRHCITVRWNSDDYYSILYKKASSKDLFKVIDKKEITYLSKFKVWEEMKRWYGENYLYNDTDNDITVSVTDSIYWIDAPDDFQFVIKPWKFAHCYEYTDIVKIIK